MFKPIKKRLKNQLGLTLVELLAVVVILGIIAAIAVPDMGGVLNKTKEDAKVAEGIQIIQAAKLYSTSQNVAFPEVVTGTNKRVEVVINKDELDKYLDNVTDNANEVRNVKDATTGKYVYYLRSHNSVAVINKKSSPATTKTELTEADLLSY